MADSNDIENINNTSNDTYERYVNICQSNVKLSSEINETINTSATCKITNTELISDIKNEQFDKIKKISKIFKIKKIDK